MPKVKDVLNLGGYRGVIVSKIYFENQWKKMMWWEELKIFIAGDVAGEWEKV